MSFQYVPFGRRIQKTFGSTTTNYLYDGDNLLEEVNSSGTVLARFIQGLGIDETLADIRGGVTSYYEADGLGSTMSLTDTLGGVVATYEYDSFGNAVRGTEGGRASTNTRYTGRQFDPETGLYYYRARYDDPTVGRFLSEDPLGIDAGDINYYAYVHNDPINRWDAFGLSSLVFNRGSGTITVVDGNGNPVGTYPAANNAQTGSRGQWDPGIYDYGYHTTHPDDAPDSRYGSNGNFVFNVPGCQGCGVHSGRANVPDKRGRTGPQHATNGCIRTTDDATSKINDLVSHGDPLTKLTVQ